MKSLEELREEAERLWVLALKARRKAIAADKVWRKALKEHYERMAQLGVRRPEARW